MEWKEELSNHGKGGSRVLQGPWKQELLGDRLSGNNCYECDLVPKVLNLCLFQFQSTKFLGESGRPVKIQRWWDWVMWGKSSCWRISMYRRQSSEEGVRWTVFRSCLPHCHNLRTVPPALTFPSPTVPPTNICQNDPPQYKSGEKRSSRGSVGPGNPHSALTKSGTLSKKHSHLFWVLYYLLNAV